MKNQFTTSHFTKHAVLGALAIITSIAPLLSSPAQAKDERRDNNERRDNGKHLGWDKDKNHGKHLGWDKKRGNAHPKYVNPRTNWNKKRPNTGWNTKPRTGQILSSSSYSTKSAALAAAERARRNGLRTALNYSSADRKWVVRTYAR